MLGSGTVAVVLALAAPCPAPDAGELLRQAETAMKKGNKTEALALAGKAIDADPMDPRARFLRGVLHDQLGKHAEAVADLGRAIKLDPKFADAYDQRGSAHFKSALIKEALADFDRFLELRPKEYAGHWRRGIALYYAGRFEEGRKQFEAYQEVDSNDVENAVWQLICHARVVGLEKARAGLLKIGHDRRVPMMVVYALFGGNAKPDDVLAAARAGKPAADELKLRLFYAHLYLGLYHEASGEAKQAREHLTKAAKEFNVPGYMGDVARVHVQLLERK